MKVRVGLVLLAVGDVNIAAETYEMGLYLIFKCDRPCNPNNFEIMNGRVASQELQDNTPTYRVFRIRAALRKTLDLRSYPFDHYPISVSIEDKFLGADKLVYVPDPQDTGIDSDVHIPGWILASHWQASVEGHRYPALHNTYSRYTFSVTITRPPLAAFLKVLLPGLFIVGVGLLALLLGPDRVMQRLTVSTSALVGAMLFHLNLTSSIPPIGYLTFADRFMIINYIVLALSIASTVILLHLTDRKLTERANRIHLLFGLTLPALWISLQIINVVAM